MGFAALFFGFSALFLGIAAHLHHLPGVLPALAAVPFLAAGIGDLLAGITYLAASIFKINPGRMFKGKDGVARFWPRALVWPYMVFEYRAWKRWRTRGREPLFERVREGLLQGGRVRDEDLPALREAGITAVLDAVAEFSAPAALRSGTEFQYLALPSLDGTAPTLAELRQGAEFVADQIQAGRQVLVHCTFGHGRSSTFSAAALILLGDAATPDQALAILKKLQRRIWLSREQKSLLAGFARARE